MDPRRGAAAYLAIAAIFEKDGRKQEALSAAQAAQALAPEAIRIDPVLPCHAYPIEDNFTDIIAKAQRGLGISDAELCQAGRGVGRGPRGRQVRAR